MTLVQPTQEKPSSSVAEKVKRVCFSLWILSIATTVCITMMSITVHHAIAPFTEITGNIIREAIDTRWIQIVTSCVVIIIILLPLVVGTGLFCLSATVWIFVRIKEDVLDEFLPELFEKNLEDTPEK